MSYILGTKSLGNLVGICPPLAAAVTEIINYSTHDWSVFSGVRSMDEQRKLVARGVSKTFNSYHLWGLAVDLVPFIDGANVWESPIRSTQKEIDDTFAETAKLMKEYFGDKKLKFQGHDIVVDWGFDLWGWDKPHYQMTGFKPMYDIRNMFEIRE
jgi:hypothetical protein